MAEPDAPAVYQPFPPFERWADLTVDTALYDSYVAAFERTRSEATDESLREAVRTATRWAAVDTGAIEGLYQVDRGFTMSVAAAASAWEAMATEVGETAARSIRDSFEAYESVLDLATGDRGPVTEALVRQLHELLCRSQETYRVHTAAGSQDQPLPKGRYKEHPNNPINLRRGEIHAYASPLETPGEMARLVAELGSPSFSSAHPVVQAAYAHYAFVCVHPFADGNGRVARALASVYLYRRPGLPLVVFADQKNDYLDALESADAGSPEPWARFVLDRVVQTAEMVSDTLRRSGGRSIVDQLNEFAPLLVGREGLTHQEIDDRGLKFLSTCRERFAQVVKAATDGSAVAGGIGSLAHRLLPPDGYRQIPGTEGFSIVLEVTGVAAVRDAVEFHASVSRDGTDGPDLLLHSLAGPVLDARLTDIGPQVSRALEYRIDLAAQEATRRLLESVLAAAKASLEQQGYRQAPNA